MADCFSGAKRSEIMSRVKGTNTSIEVKVRGLLHRLGYRFRLHCPGLPGKPDIVLPKRQAVILVHGCFWHGHPGCPRSKRPKSNSIFWANKIDGNIARDKSNARSLRDLGWRVLVVWECQTKNNAQLTQRLQRFLERPSAPE